MTSQHKVVAGVSYDRNIFEAAEGFAADGQVSFTEAKDLWELAADPPTAEQKLSLEYTMRNHKYTQKATDFLNAQIVQSKKRASAGSSYYKVIGGVKRPPLHIRTRWESWMGLGVICSDAIFCHLYPSFQF